MSKLVTWLANEPATWWFLPCTSAAIAPPTVTWRVPGETGTNQPCGSPATMSCSRETPASATTMPLAGSRLMMLFSLLVEMTDAARGLRRVVVAAAKAARDRGAALARGRLREVAEQGRGLRVACRGGQVSPGGRDAAPAGQADGSGRHWAGRGARHGRHITWRAAAASWVINPCADAWLPSGTYAGHMVPVPPAERRVAAVRHAALDHAVGERDHRRVRHARRHPRACSARPRR